CCQLHHTPPERSRFAVSFAGTLERIAQLRLEGQTETGWRGCAGQVGGDGPDALRMEGAHGRSPPLATNPFFTRSTLPYGLPPFAEIREEHYLPAFERGMAEQLAEVAEITGNPEPPTFDNTIAALERSGAILERVSAVFFNQVSCDATPGVREIQKEITPRLAKHADAIRLNGALFARIKKLYRDLQEDRDAFDPEEAWLLERYYTDFVRAGAELSDAGKERLVALNEELSELSTAFQQ